MAVSNENPPLHPFHKVLLSHHLDKLTRIQRGINAIARTIYAVQIERECAEEGADPAPWFNDNLQGGLLEGITMLVSSAHSSLECLANRTGLDQDGEGAQ
ncbi:MAG: hypothetical protein ABTQ93_01660 [Candidatus Competibacter denitrificans]